MAIDVDGFLLNYDLTKIDNTKFNNHINKEHQIEEDIYCYKCSEELFNKFNSSDIKTGITITCSGFYSSQGRSIRLNNSYKNHLDKLKKLYYDNYNATNLEMETAIIYGMSNLLGHKAISLNAILANRELEEYSTNPDKTIENLIDYVLKRI